MKRLQNLAKWDSFLAQALHNPPASSAAQPPFWSMMDQRSDTKASMLLLLPFSSSKLNFSKSLSSTSSMALMGVVGVSDTWTVQIG